MAVSCCSSAALFTLPRSDSRCGVVSSKTMGSRLQISRSGLLYGAGRRIGPRRLTPGTCLANTKPSTITGESWDELVLDSETPVLVEFYAKWCGPCHIVHRVIDKIAAEYSGKLKCFVLDADCDSTVVDKYGVKAVPVVVLFKDGEKRDSIVGTMPEDFYVDAIEKVLAS